MTPSSGLRTAVVLRPRLRLVGGGLARGGRAHFLQRGGVRAHATVPEGGRTAWVPCRLATAAGAPGGDCIEPSSFRGGNLVATVGVAQAVPPPPARVSTVLALAGAASTITLVVPNWMLVLGGTLLMGIFVLFTRVLLFMFPVLAAVLRASNQVSVAATTVTSCAQEVEALAELLQTDLKLVESLTMGLSSGFSSQVKSLQDLQTGLQSGLQTSPLASVEQQAESAEVSLRKRLYQLGPTLASWRSRLGPLVTGQATSSAKTAKGEEVMQGPACRIDGPRRESRASRWLAKSRLRSIGWGLFPKARAAAMRREASARREAKRLAREAAEAEDAEKRAARQKAIDAALAAEAGMERAISDLEEALEGCDDVGGCAIKSADLPSEKEGAPP